ncbi:MAG: putative pilus biosis operon protein [Myxococcaceae bacterium]|nr:putative pilus biosis operon protein [Myxococcaceae bacterium]
MRGAPRRGQSLAETAIGLVAFVIILTFGIHFAETTLLAMKVTEAAAAPLWDATALKMHTLPTSFSEAKTSLGVAQGNAQGRYADFDGRSSVSRGSAVTEVFTAASGMSISCSMGGVYNFFAGGPPPYISNTYRDNGGAQCTASASAASIRMSLFKYTYCAIGRGGRQPCRGSMSMLLDDWGLAGPAESSECVVKTNGGGCNGNAPYSKSVENAFDAVGDRGTAHVRLVQFALQRLPPNLAQVTDFYLSYRGEESKFTETVNAGDNGDPDWHTTPFATPPQYEAAHGSRSNSYLGM